MQYGKLWRAMGRLTVHNNIFITFLATPWDYIFQTSNVAGSLVVKWSQMTEFDQRNESRNDVVSAKMAKSRCDFFKFLLCSSYLMLQNKSLPNLMVWNNFIMLMESID